MRQNVWVGDVRFHNAIFMSRPTKAYRMVRARVFFMNRSSFDYLAYRDFALYTIWLANVHTEILFSCKFDFDFSYVFCLFSEVPINVYQMSFVRIVFESINSIRQ